MRWYKICSILTTSLFILVFCTNKTPQSDSKYNDIFIAHGGGAVDGHNKTNSLEALNASYKNGFKMFELDFQLTIDNKIVAVHDPIEVTEAEFLSQRIEDKFTPMNLEMVNHWFENHPDAILVTDKINRPDLFAAQFKFKERLIMELFSWEEVTEAINLGITPMVSQNIFWTTPDIEKMIDSLGIKIVGMHREYIENDKQLLMRLKEKGIKTYVWHTNKKIEGMIPEEYMWKNDMEYCHGIYVWSNIEPKRIFCNNN